MNFGKTYHKKWREENRESVARAKSAYRARSKAKKIAALRGEKFSSVALFLTLLCHYNRWKKMKCRDAKAWYARNPVRTKQLRAARVSSGYDNAWSKKRRSESESYRLAVNLRHRVWSAVTSGGGKKSARTLELVGCSVEELKAWLTGWFQPGMSWENYGAWHIDHHFPCNAFDLTDLVQQRRCFSFLNLRPLWAVDNLKKGALTPLVSNV